MALPATTASTGVTLGVNTAAASNKYINFNYIATLVTQKVFIAPLACRVTGIYGATRVAGSGGACTLSFYKVPDGTAVASGTLLHSGSYNMVGTADTNQYLTLVNDPSVLLLNVGDAIGYVLTGTATSAVGTITIAVEPVAP